MDTDRTPIETGIPAFPAPAAPPPRRLRDPDGDEGNRWIGLVLTSIMFFVLYVVGTVVTWQSTCSMAFGKEMEATGTLARFCTGRTTYQDNHHFWFWPVPLIAFVVLGVYWVIDGEWRWYAATWLAGGVLACLYYSPFLLLPG